MGLLDHKKTWRFRLKAEPEACADAFRKALTSKGALALVKANWKWSTSVNASGLPVVVAVYEGRAGITKGLTMLSRRSSEEEEVAVGSRLNFEVEEFDQATGRASCSLWFALVGKTMGFTADARFFRNYMNAVSDALHNLDGGIVVTKD